jgi:phage gp36-like protein
VRFSPATTFSGGVFTPALTWAEEGGVSLAFSPATTFSGGVFTPALTWAEEGGVSLAFSPATTFSAGVFTPAETWSAGGGAPPDFASTATAVVSARATTLPEVAAGGPADGDGDILVSSAAIVGFFSSAVAMSRGVVRAQTDLVPDFATTAVARVGAYVSVPSVALLDFGSSAIALSRPLVQADAMPSFASAAVAITSGRVACEAAFGGAIIITARYAALIDMIRAFGEAELVQLTDRDADRSQEIDITVLDGALTAADMIIDGYLAARYAVPLEAPVPQSITDIACDIARYRLYDKSPPKVVVDRYRDAISRLRDYQAGRATLPLVASAGGQVQFVSAPATFRRDEGGFI